MAKKVLLRDWNNDEVLPITRGELVLDSSGKEAFRSNEFLATTSQPGLMSSEDKFKIDNIEGIGNIANDKVSQVNTTTSDVYRLLFSETADDVTRTEGARKSAKLTFNPSTGVLQTSGLIGNIDGTYVNKLTGYSKATLISDITSEDTLVSALGKVELRAEVAYNLIQGAYDGDGTIENLAEILKVLEGISDTETIQAIVGKYLPLSGGTITSDSYSGGLTLKRNASSAGVALWFANNTGSLGALVCTENKELQYDNGASAYTLIHSGNIGEQSVSYAYNAGQLGGISADKYLYSREIPSGTSGDINSSTLYNGQSFILGWRDRNVTNTPASEFSMAGGNLLYVTGSYSGFMLASGPYNSNLYFRSGFNTTSPGQTINSATWKTIAFTDSNVASATKLKDNTAYTAWGAIYFNNGKPQNVDNSLYIGTNYGLFLNKDLEGIYLTGDGVNWHNASNTWTKSIIRFNSSGNVTIGASDLATTAVKLYVDGDISSTNLWPIITISKSLTITSDWTDTGISFNSTNFPHGNGSYILQMDRENTYFYTGYLSVVLNDGAVSVDDVDEIILHGGGFDSASQYYLRTKQDASSKTTKIQIATSGPTHTRTINFKFKRII